MVGVGGEYEVAGEHDDQLGEGEVHQQPVDRRLELQQGGGASAEFCIPSNFAKAKIMSYF